MIDRSKRRRHPTLFFLALLLMGAFAYLTFAAVAQFFLGNAGFFAVTIIVIVLLLPPYIREHRHRRRTRERRILYRPRPEKVPGRSSDTRLEAEILASFILGAAAAIMFVVGFAARIASWYPLLHGGNYPSGGVLDLGLYTAGLVLSMVGIWVLRALFWSWRVPYDPYDHDGSIL
jgi:hypothetical protein